MSCAAPAVAQRMRRYSSVMILAPVSANGNGEGEMPVAGFEHSVVSGTPAPVEACRAFASARNKDVTRTSDSMPYTPG